MLEKYNKSVKIEDLIREKKLQTCLSGSEFDKYLRAHIPAESYYQNKIIKGLKAHCPNAFIAKIAQGMYSTRGIPDIMCIVKGHYFGFEVKRPVFGKLSDVQKRAMDDIVKTGGTAAVITYPEEAYEIIDRDVLRGI